MKAVFRADASVEIGTGHVMRCLALADILKRKGAEIAFVCRSMSGDMCDFIRKKGFMIFPIHGPDFQSPAFFDWRSDVECSLSILRGLGRIDWLVLDHYGLGKKWEEKVRPFVDKIMVIDDLANRNHDCDLLLDQNLCDDMETRYDALVPGNCFKLLGPRFALLRPEFLEARKASGRRNGEVECILISFGGSDLSNQTEKAIEAMRTLRRPDIALDVVVGASNPHKEQIESICVATPACSYHCQVSYMGELMSRAELCIGAGGSSTWERCCLGLPSVTIVVAENQWDVAEKLHSTGVTSNLGWHQKVTVDQIASIMKSLLSDKRRLSDMSSKAMYLVDGRGLGRVSKFLLPVRINLRPVKKSDCKLFWQWANDPVVRGFSFSPGLIDWDEHKRWFSHKMSDTDCYLFIAENEKGNSIGQIRFHVRNGIAEVSYSLDAGSRGMGLGSELVNQGIKSLMNYFEAPLTIQGKVKKENLASNMIFSKLGFAKMDSPDFPFMHIYKMQLNGSGYPG